MDELEKFLDGRNICVDDGHFKWVLNESWVQLFTKEETFKFLTLSTQAYRESLRSTP